MAIYDKIDKAKLKKPDTFFSSIKKHPKIEDKTEYEKTENSLSFCLKLGFISLIIFIFYCIFILDGKKLSYFSALFGTIIFLTLFCSFFFVIVYKLRLKEIEKEIRKKNELLIQKKNYSEDQDNYINRNIKRPKYLMSDGIGYEQYCKFCLENIEGFYNVKTTAVTGDYGADLIAQKNDEKYCIQCKNYDGTVSPAAVREVLASLPIYNANKGMVITNSYLSKEAKEIARANNIIIWEHYGKNDILNINKGQIYF